MKRMPPLRLFISYAHDDDDFRKQLENHLASLAHAGVIETWSDREIDAGVEWAATISEKLDAADIIVLLISPAFLASKFIHEKELARAMERHDNGEARVIPVFVKPCDWKEEAFGKLQGVPADAKAVTTWQNHDHALAIVAEAIGKAAQSLRSTNPRSKEHPSDRERQTRQAASPPDPYQLSQGSRITLASVANALLEAERGSGSLDVLVIFGSGRHKHSSNRVGLISDALYLPEIASDLSDISINNHMQLHMRSALDIDLLGPSATGSKLLHAYNIISIGTPDVNGITGAIFDAFRRRGNKGRLVAWFDGFYVICESRKLPSGTRNIKYPHERGLGLLSAFVNPWNDSKMCLVAGGSRALGTVGAMYLLHLYLQSYLDPAHSALKISRNAIASPARIFEAVDRRYCGSIKDESVLNPREDIRNINEDIESWSFHD